VAREQVVRLLLDVSQPGGRFYQQRAFADRRDGKTCSVRAGAKADLLLVVSAHRANSNSGLHGIEWVIVGLFRASRACR